MTCCRRTSVETWGRFLCHRNRPHVKVQRSLQVSFRFKGYVVIYHNLRYNNISFRLLIEMETAMDEMDWIIYFGLPIIAFFLFFVYQAHENKKKNLKKIRESFGKKAEKNYYHEEFENISHGFYLQENDSNIVDDITWNDMNMDEIFRNMDSTASSLGQEALYSMLRKPVVSDEELNERKRIMDYFAEHEEERTILSYTYSNFGYSRKMSVADYIESLEECGRKSIVPHIAMMLMFFGALIYCLCFNVVAGMWAVIIIAALNIISYFRFKADIETYFICIKQTFSMCVCAENILRLNIDGISGYKDELEGYLKELSGARRFSWIMSTGKGGILEFLLDYVRMITHLDIVKFCMVVNTLNRKKNTVWALYNRLGYFDALIAAASYRAYLPYTCVPVFYNGVGQRYEVKDLYHPLIEKPVTSSIRTDCSILVTGSNASGKSTFLRAAGINAILSQTLYMSASHEYKGSRFRIYSSMALKDNLLNNESYYMVEIKSLKRIMDAAKSREKGSDYPVLCFIDEVLRGTNTVERIAASSQILKSLAMTNTICFAATHDIELTNILERIYTNYHFTEDITDNDVHFGYELMKGRATSRNAIKLLGLLGYDASILRQATEAAKHFEESGVWSIE